MHIGSRRLPWMATIFVVYFVVRNWEGDVWPLVVVGVIAVAAAFAYKAYQTRSSRQRAEKVEQADVASLNEVVQSKLARTANRILDVEARPGLTLSSEANEFFQKAVSTFVAVDEKLPAAATAHQLEAILTDLDDALWRLDASEAILDGEDIPARPGANRTSGSLPPISSAIPTDSRDAVSRWSDDRGGGGHRRRRRSC